MLIWPIKVQLVGCTSPPAFLHRLAEKVFSLPSANTKSEPQLFIVLCFFVCSPFSCFLWVLVVSPIFVQVFFMSLFRCMCFAFAFACLFCRWSLFVLTLFPHFVSSRSQGEGHRRVHGWRPETRDALPGASEDKGRS